MKSLIEEFRGLQISAKKGTNMTKRDIAGYLNVDYKTLYNWQNTSQIYIKQ